MSGIKTDKQLLKKVKYNVDEIARHRTELRNLVEYITDINEKAAHACEIMAEGLDELSEVL